jgi:hypothetical protein
MNKIVFSRKELYNLVWSEPISSILKKYEISSSELRKIHKEMRIPLPEMGYWQKIQHGKPIEIKELSNDYSGRMEVSFIIRDNPFSFNRSPYKTLKESLENDPNLITKVNQRLAKPDILIIEARESLKKKRSESDSRYVGLNYGRYKGVVETKSNELRIRVSPANVGRALRFFDAFIKLIRSRNHDIIIEYDRTYAVIENEKFEISLKEKFIRTKSSDSWLSFEYQPAGILAFKLESYPYKEWKDGQRLIEDRLPDILAWFEL